MSTPSDSIVFHSREEALHDGVVATITLAAHASLDAVVGEKLLELISRVLPALIAVMQRIRIRPPGPDRHDQRICR